MINVCIYLDRNEDAINLVNILLKNGLAAHGSIDVDNQSYFNVDGTVIQKANFVLTLQTKALLFSKIEDVVINTLGNTIKIYSFPITQCNNAFSETIRLNTEKI